jgi:hypothetical protein
MGFLSVVAIIVADKLSAKSHLSNYLVIHMDTSAQSVNTSQFLCATWPIQCLNLQSILSAYHEDNFMQLYQWEDNDFQPANNSHLVVYKLLPSAIPHLSSSYALVFVLRAKFAPADSDNYTMPLIPAGFHKDYVVAVLVIVSWCNLPVHETFSFNCSGSVVFRQHIPGNFTLWYLPVRLKMGYVAHKVDVAHGHCSLHFIVATQQSLSQLTAQGLKFELKQRVLIQWFDISFAQTYLFLSGAATVGVNSSNFIRLTVHIPH